ncbi:MAG: DUF6531 domain-containing protein, partial [Methanomicrobiales archaeon]|nr:DUF6531 domain-containing protein [Methanomicrobiales archaeon]
MTDKGTAGYTWNTVPGLTQNALATDNTNTSYIAYIYGGRLLYWTPSSGTTSDLAAASSPAIARRPSAIGITYVNTTTSSVEYLINESGSFNPATAVNSSATGPAIALGSLYIYYLKSDGVDNEIWVATDQTMSLPDYSTISYVYPRSVVNASKTYLTVYGRNFEDPMLVALKRENLTIVSANSVIVADPSTIMTRFDLAGVPFGVYDINVKWANGTEESKSAAVTISELPEGVLIKDSNMNCNEGGTVQYEVVVPPTPNLFVTLRKVQNWDGIVTLTYNGAAVASDRSYQDQILHVRNPVPGNYTVSIASLQSGTGTMEVSTSLPALPDGDWILASIYRPYGSTFHQIDIPPGKSSLSFNAEAMGTWSRFRIHREQWGSGQQWISSSGPAASLSITDPSAGLYIIEFMDTTMAGRTNEGQAREVLLKASTTGQVSPSPTYLPAISAYTPKSGGNTGIITAQIKGAWLESNATVNLEGIGGTNISAYSVNGSAGKTILEASFNLIGKTPGEYTLTVTNPNGQTITSSVPFTIEQGGRSELWTEITGREKVRAGRPATYIISFGNKGNLDMPAPVLSVATDPPSSAISVRYPPSQDWHPMTGAESVVAKGPAGNPDVLPAGYSSQIEIEAKTNQMSDFELVLLPYGGDPVFVTNTVEKSVDAFAPAPGIPLSFDRSYPGRYSSYVGPFGYGWVHSFDMHLEEFADGTIGLMKGDALVTLLLNRGDQNCSAEGGCPEFTRNADSSSVLTMRGGSTFEFGTNQKLSSYADINGNQVMLSYSGEQLTGIQHSDGDQFILNYGLNGRIISLTDQAGKVTTYSYNPDNSFLTSVTRSSGEVTTYSYDTISDTYALLSVMYPGGITRNFRFDGDGRLAESSLNSNKGAVSTSYDEGERTTTVKDTTGSSVRIKVNENGQVVKTENAAGASQEFTYDQNNDLVRGSDPLGNSLQLAYDEEHNIEEINDQLGNKISLTYDSQFNALNSLTDPRGNALNFGFDSNGNMVSITYPDSRVESDIYDTKGNIIRTTTRKGDVINYQYNTRGQQARIDYPDGSFAAYTYDNSGNLLTAANPGGTVTLEYNARNQPTKILFPDGNSFVYTYNNAGLLSSRTEKDGYSEVYAYDDQGNLIQVSDGNMSVIARYTYDSAGNLQRKELRNGGYTTYAYDTVGQISRLVNYNTTGAVLSRFDYQYDAAGNPVSVDTLEGTYQYSYDALGQLVNVAYPGGNVTQYSYDAAGNRVSLTDGGTTTAYTTNVMNQYTQVGSATFTYDANGNLISKGEGGNTTTYEYNYANRLIRVTSPDGVYSYTYDALGNRAGVTYNGNLTRYSVDPLGIGDVVAEYNGSGALIARYTHGLGLLSKIGPSGSEYYYSFNPTGHTMGITDSTGKVVNQYQYTPFGEYRQKYETITNPFTYVGEYGVMDDGNGLLYMRLRHYSSNLGRFVSEDKLNFRDYVLHAYKYSQNNPISYIDPVGTSDKKIDWINVGFGVGKSVGAGLLLAGVATGVIAGSPFFTGFVVLGSGYNAYQGSKQVANELAGRPQGSTGGFFEDWGDSTDSSFLKDVGWGADMVLACGAADWSKWYTPPLIYAPIGKKCYDETKRDLDNKKTKRKMVSPRTSVDPEDKYGPAGYDAPGTPSESRHHYISRDTPLNYRVDFWNAENATANVSDVDAYDDMDSNLNWSTFMFTEVGFTDWTVPLEPTKYFSVYVDTSPSMDYVVQIEGTFDPATGRANLTYYTLNATTLETPEDPLAGFLPAISASGKEIGWFSYTIEPKSGLSSGTVIENRAWVNFDYSQFMP